MKIRLLGNIVIKIYKTDLNHIVRFAWKERKSTK